MLEVIKLASPQENVDKFRAWKATMDDEAIVEYIYRGDLNKRRIARNADIGYSALKPENGNPQLLNEIDEYREELVQSGILQAFNEKIQSKSSDEDPVLRDTTSKKALKVEQRSSVLEEEVIALRAKVQKLEEELSRYTELSQVLDELGVIPK